MATINANPTEPNQPRISITGAVERVQTYVTSASLSDGDVIKFNGMKIPHGATVTDVRLIGKSVDGTFIFQIGNEYTSQGAVHGSATFSPTQASFVKTNGLPYKLSVSDDYYPRHAAMTLTVNGATTSGTASLSVTLFVRYVMDQ